MPFEQLLTIVRTYYADAVFPAAFADGTLRILWANRAAASQIPLLTEKGSFCWPEGFPQAEVLHGMENNSSYEMAGGTGCRLMFLPVKDASGQTAIQILGASGAGADFLRDAPALLEKGGQLPLTLIFSTVTLLARETKGNAMASGYLKLILQNAYRLLRFSNMLKELSGLSSGALPLVLRYGDLRAFLCRFCETANSLTEPIDISISCLVPDMPVRTLFDQKRLQTALLNLVSNACRYSQDGNRITIKMTASAKEAKISVTDSGAGIEPARLAALFRSGDRQLDKITSGERAESGAGLGLPLARKIMEKHGGRLHIESRPGKGTCVTLTLPLRQDGAAQNYVMQEGGDYQRNRFSRFYVELADVCDVPMP